MMEYSKPDFVFRVVLVGDVGVGKTAIYNAYRKFYFVNGHQMGYFEVKLRRQNKRVLLKIYDTQGQERYRSLTNSYFRDSNGCVMCFDVTNRSSFESLDQWLCDIHEHVGQEIPCVVAATKCNVSECKREVTFEQAARYTDKNRMSLFEIVTLDKQTLDSLFYDLIDKMIKSVTCNDALENKDNVNMYDTYHRNTTKCSC